MVRDKNISEMLKLFEIKDLLIAPGLCRFALPVRHRLRLRRMAGEVAMAGGAKRTNLYRYFCVRGNDSIFRFFKFFDERNALQIKVTLYFVSFVTI